MGWKHNVSFSQFKTKAKQKLTDPASKVSALKDYRDRVGEIAGKYRLRKWSAKATGNLDAKWQEILSRARLGFNDRWQGFAGKISHDNIRKLTPDGASSPDIALALHYALHASDDRVDRITARCMDRSAFGKSAEQVFSGPVFTFEPNDYYEPPPMAAPMAPPDYISEKAAQYLLKTDVDDGIWLNPHNHFILPLEGREEEKKRLTNFMKPGQRFRVQPIIAPSGAGKTRLISEWMKTYSAVANPETEWEAGFLVSGRVDNARSPEPWKTWEIKKNTLIVIDYTYAFDEVVKIIAERAINQPVEQEHQIRLIVVDHVMPKVLDDDFFWRQFSGGHSATMDGFRTRYLEKPLFLKSETDKSDMLRQIIAASARVGRREISNSDPLVSDALHHLDRIGREMGDRDSIRHPLFAALMGRALRDANGTPDFSTWSRRDLVTHYFKNHDRLPWAGDGERTERSGQGLYAGAVVSAATLLRGMRRQSSKKHLPRENKAIFQIARRVISSENTHEIGPFLPDILGETFMLKFLEAADAHAEVKASFLSMLSETGGEPLESARNFRETIARLARNLAGDDPDLEDVQESWEHLIEFLDPRRFAEEGPLRTYVSYACADVMEELAGIEARANTVGNNLLAETYRTFRSQLEAQVEVDRLCAENEGEDLATWARTALGFYEFSEIEENDPKAEKIIVVARVFSDERKKIAEKTSTVHGLFANQREKRWTATMLASFEGLLRALSLISRNLNENVNSTVGDGWTAAMMASQNGHLEVLRYLHRETECDLDATREDGWTAAMGASQNGHLEVLRYLHRDAGCDLKATREDGWTAALSASLSGRLEVLRYLHREAGCDLKATKKYGMAVIAACQNGHIEVLRYLHLEAGCGLKAMDETERTDAVQAAGAHGQLEVLRYLHLEAGWDLNVTDALNFSAVFRACRNGHLEVLRYLHREAGCDVDAATSGGWTAAMMASRYGHLDVLRYLHLDAECDLNAVAFDGATAVMMASMKGQIDTLRYLHREAECDLNAKDELSSTAAMMASQNGHLEVLRYLHRDAGCDLAAATDDGWTAAMSASLSGHLEVLRYLHREAGCDLTATREDGWTALMLASKRGHLPIIRYLLLQGADCTLKTNGGQTALSFAEDSGYADVATVLREAFDRSRE